MAKHKRKEDEMSGGEVGFWLFVAGIVLMVLSGQ